MDTTPIEERLRQIRSSLFQLREIQPLEYDEFVLSVAAVNIAEHQFQVAIQAAIDISQKLLADIGAPLPESYADVFPKLGEVGILPEGFAERLTAMAKFRNVLVHLYLEVDLRKVYSYLQNQLDDLERFSEHIVMYISQGTAEAEGGTLSDGPVGG